MVNSKNVYGLSPFPHSFGQVKEWVILKLHEMIRVSHVVACPIVFVLLYNRVGHGGVLKM